MEILFIFIIAIIGYLGDYTGTTFIDRPLVTSMLVGLFFGDLQNALIIGASLELVWMGLMGIGATVPPDVVSGGILGTVFALETGSGIEVALTLALPIATVGMIVKNILYAVVIPWMNHVSDDLVEKGKLKQAVNMHQVACWTKIIVLSLLVTAAYGLGSIVMTDFLAAIPSVIIDGMNAATMLIPTVGFAMLLSMNFNFKVAPFFVLGFVLAAYLQMDMLSIALIGLSLGLIMFIIMDEIGKNKSGQLEVVEDDEF